MLSQRCFEEFLNNLMLCSNAITNYWCSRVNGTTLWHSAWCICLEACIMSMNGMFSWQHMHFEDTYRSAVQWTDSCYHGNNIYSGVKGDFAGVLNFRISQFFSCCVFGMLLTASCITCSLLLHTSRCHGNKHLF